MRDSLASSQPITPMTDGELFTKKSQAWHQQGIFVIDLKHGSLTDGERGVIENIGNRLYGRRNG